MTNTTRPFWRLAKLPLAVSLASTLASPAFAVNFNIGEIEGQFDSSLSVGASWSTEKADKDLIGASNGGRGLSQTSDDGRLNFKRGETFSKIFKGIHDLELKYGDTGVFVRGKYWYDFELKDESREFKDISDSNRKEGAKSSGGEILDAFIYHNYTIADQPGTVRLGKQVVSWGESTFLQNGISSINPVDVAAFRRPGAEVKEALIPVNMFYMSQSLTDTLSVEAFYQLEWDQTITENCGTFFSQVDIMSDGCDNNLAVLSTRESVFNSLVAATGSPVAANALLQQLSGAGATWGDPDEGVVVRRHGDKDARDDGQWGVAFRYLFEPLDTEFGAYFMNYHSRAPIFSGVAPSAAGLTAANNLATTLVTGGLPPSTAARLGALPLAGSGGYFAEYPEDIRLYGLSFSTTLPTGTAWSGEISYRPNAPVQLNSTDILYAGLRDMTIAGSVKPYANVSPLSAGSDGLLHGYNRKEITQLQTTFTHFFDQVMGASRLTLVGEVGWTHVGGLESTRNVRYGRDPVFGSAGDMCTAVNTGTAGANPDLGNVAKGCDRDGFTTSDSWGYRTRAIWEYPDVIAGVNFKPNVAWSHDVKGYSPGPGGNFEEGRKAVSLGLDAEYQNTYTASLAYTNFFDGKYSTVHDRDFVALSFGMNF
ncbi:DUF1302 domain-containing protein [Pseudomonas sp. PDM11]|uniref:DUF1302 domain-containing protein n=1 Tax=Pseudomonas sp. PDM11 TaxID=2769309 RepID=UPI00177F8181|nr:DUF1302 domain-containing protein [Pseudomonas sp. PDM11]MBD9396050.1 DUF1302 domain-containing protein [Pseudomonas sp. PDM11]